MNIRYWDGEKNVAQSVYYNLRFLQRPNVVNLKEEIMNAIQYVDVGKFLHLGMDGPSTNWNVLDLINDHQVVNEFQKALDIGSCLLHILHSALQTGMIKPGWDIRHFIRYLMPHLLATMYIYVKGHPKYCTTRWIEDQPVAARALDVWPSVVSTVKHWISLSKSKQPKNN